MLKSIIIASVIWVGVGNWSWVNAEEPEWEDLSRGEFDFRSVWVEPVDQKVILAGCRSGVVRSEDGGANWRNTLSVRGDNRAINFLANDRDNFYACTGNGLFRSNNQGRSWNRLFRGRNSYEADCQIIAASAGKLFLGSNSGLFTSCDNGRSWQKVNNKLGSSRILAIVVESNNVYVACVDGVFKSKDSGGTWENIFVKHSTENGKETEEMNEDRDEEERFSDIRYLARDQRSGYLYLATAKGVVVSKDEGATWENLTDFGLLSQDVLMVSVSKDSDLYAVTKSGIFIFKSGRWQELSFDLAAGDIRFVAVDDKDNLYAACEKGLFRSKIELSASFKAAGLANEYLSGEPKIGEVQKAAIKYAEVEPEKIINWRKQAAKKALLPQFDVSAGRNTTDLWHWETGSSTKNEDDNLRRGHDSLDWDVSLSWDLGELVWNNDQTSIDTRSRLMVQLRDDILDEVNKTYFERIRVKDEINNLAIEDRKKRFEKELRLQELTASLDSLTGGFFSQSLQQVK
ncbi:MAG: hypothetical protein NT088_05795 [Candidatus Omnitrophica bacterium]|nr:hypothetical protein [Candidatus Omnitrophota bacterium]